MGYCKNLAYGPIFYKFLITGLTGFGKLWQNPSLGVAIFSFGRRSKRIKFFRERGCEDLFDPPSDQKHLNYIRIPPQIITTTARDNVSRFLMMLRLLMAKVLRTYTGINVKDKM